jgi:hypothetical protein
MVGATWATSWSRSVSTTDGCLMMWRATLPAPHSGLRLRSRGRAVSQRGLAPLAQMAHSPLPDFPASTGTRRERSASPGGEGLRPLPTEPGRVSPV